MEVMQQNPVSHLLSTQSLLLPKGIDFAPNKSTMLPT